MLMARKMLMKIETAMVNLTPLTVLGRKESPAHLVSPGHREPLVNEANAALSALPD